MKFAAKAVALSLSVLFSLETYATELKHWPAEAARQLDSMIA
ncbi:haloacid dehalogenase-like hydrolase, partial [Pseudomonas sp. CM25]|nr:haloacid dehalogenase-like hydrolase [Pseudomonas sp. CM25]